MNEAPFYSPHLARYRGQAKSSMNNQAMNEIMYDITDLFNQANTAKDSIERMKKMHDITSHFNQNHVDGLKAMIEKLQQDIAAIQSPGHEYTKTIYPQDMYIDDSTPEYEQALIDKQHDVVMLPYSVFSSSKLFVYDEINDEYILPKQLQYKVLPEADGASIIDSDFRPALLPDAFDLWHREYRYFSGLKNEATAQVVLDLPEDIITNKDVNTIYVHPFPLNSVDIMNVEYRLNGEWTTIPGFVPVLEANNSKFCFTELEMRSVRITLRQRNFIEKGGRQIFHMGIRELGVLNNDYQNGIGRFVVPVELNKTFVNKEILGVKAVFSNETALSVYQNDSRLATFKVFEVDSNGKETYLNDTFPIRTSKDKILLKGTVAFDKNTRITPTISRVEVTYKGD